uniref:Kinesin motor domain-containing protein n=1 Tax=Clytia hemisphaerica TaxID=252671 RepID=A0A7M5WTB1_9CNID
MEVQARPRGKSSSSRNPSVNESSLNSTLAGGYDSNEGDNIKVFVRIRPPHKQIHEGGDNNVCLEVNSPKSLTIFTKPEPKQFSYDHVANMETTQEEVFATVGKGIMEAFIDGFNGTIFAYGQTGSGKTFTMLGPPDDGDNFSHELRGVIPRGFEYIFSLINRQQEKAGDRVEFIARCSFLEIYNEQVFDLLEPSTASLNLRENIKKGVFVEGLGERDVSSAKDAYGVLQSGWMNRRVASTSMNRESSRSHAVFTVSLESKKRSGGMNNIKVSKLHLVDLAGSERQKDTNTEDVRLKEAGSINKSLSALGNVIMALVDIAHGKTRHVHYRDSKLTFILRDSLGGNAKTFIIANVHPSSRCFGETLSTLNFARRAKMIKNKAVMNEDVTGNVRELQQEIRKLKEMLSQARAGIPQEPKANQDTPTPSSSDDHQTTTSSKEENEGASHWKEMMLNAINEREQTEQEKLALQEKVQKLEDLCSKKEKFLQSTRMILKFRTEHISKLERTIKKNGLIEESEKDKEIKSLKDENKILQASIDSHPEVKRFAIENLELRAEIKRLKSLDPSNGDFTKNMAEKHRYTLHLERQLRDLMSTQTNDLEKSLSSSQQSLEASNAEVERMKMDIAHVQARVDTLQNELKESRENIQQKTEELVHERELMRKKEMESSANEAALRKTNNELERQLESLSLSTAMERQSMSSLHIQTIKTLSTPKKFGTPRSTPKKTPQVSTPVHLAKRLKTEEKQGAKNEEDNKENVSSLNGSYVNDPDRPIQDEPPPRYILERKDSLNDVTDSEDETTSDVNVFNESYLHNSHNQSVDAEAVYIDALQNEVKQLQDWYNDALKKYYNEQHKQIPLLENIAKLEHKVKDLDQLLTNERQEWSSKEVQLTNQLTALRDNYKETQGNATILKSEVDDLKSSLSSAESQLQTLKKEKNESNIESTRKYAALESKHVKLEIEYFNLQTENDETAERNNNLQVDYDQVQDECEYYRHKNSELEHNLEAEKKMKLEAEEQKQIALEKLSYEYETKIKYSQDKESETLNELLEKNNTINKELEEKVQKITSLTEDVEKARKELTTQKWLHIKDGQVINNFMKKVEDLNMALGDKDTNISALNSELEDVKEQHHLLQKHYDEKKLKIHKLQDALKVESDKLMKEKSEREKEVTSLQEEILIAQDQCRELTTTLNENTDQLKKLQIT